LICWIFTTLKQTMIKVIVNIFQLSQSKSLKVWNFNHTFLNTNSFYHFMNSLCRKNRICFSTVIFFIFHNWIRISRKKNFVWMFIIKKSDFLFAYFFFILRFFIFYEIWVIRWRYFYNWVNQNVEIGFLLFSFKIEFYWVFWDWTFSSIFSSFWTTFKLQLQSWEKFV